MSKVKEDALVKALSEMETIAKADAGEADTGSGKLPKTTAQANGGFSTEGDKTELATTDKSMAKATDEDEESSDESDESEEAKKAMADDDESSDDESSSDEEEYKSAKMKKTKKSTIADLIKSDLTSGPVVDVSPFIEKLVDEVSNAELQLRKSVNEFYTEQSGFNSAMQKSVVALGNLVLEIKKSVDQFMDQPATARKSMLSKSEVNERFESENTYDFDKQQVLDAMVNLVQKGQIQPLHVSMYEATNHMEPTVQKAVENYLRK